MSTFQLRLAAVVIIAACLCRPAHAVELTVSRDALERTLRQQLFAGPDGRYYLKGDAQSACYTYAQDPHLSFEQDRIVVRMKTSARMGRRVAGSCIGLSLTEPAEVSFTPEAEGETIGFRDARIDRISDQRELNFLLMPFLRHKIPASMRVNAADLLRRALAGSAVSSGYKVSLDRLKVHSIVIDGDALVIDADGAISVK
ncbi:MAG TPA: hypothetical protein VKU93_00545 [Terracidiphilus sp.]|nr:hypothetical protein [Terracidiphilus sp.]